MTLRTTRTALIHACREFRLATKRGDHIREGWNTRLFMNHHIRIVDAAMEYALALRRAQRRRRAR